MEATLHNQTSKSALLGNIGNHLRKFHEEEDGINIAEVILLLFVAAVIIITVTNFIQGGNFWGRVVERVGEVLGLSSAR